VLRKECILRVSENKALRRILETQREIAIREWRKLHNEQLHNLYSESNIIREIRLQSMRWAKPATHMWAMRSAYKILVGKPEGEK
jgi:hypothetical protein